VVALVIEDMLRGEYPHSPADLADWFSLAGIALVAMGVSFRSWAAGVLQKNVALATIGPYRITRNPLYFGSLLMTLGFCTLIGDWDNALAMIALAIMLYWPKIRNEEAYLSLAFGEVWGEYVRKTPRLIPHRLRLKGAFEGWHGRQWVANREYNALVGACLGLLGIQLWFALLTK
jgi:protein-S-isoprenylcysteine O-methyltransferase Ste14